MKILLLIFLVTTFTFQISFGKCSNPTLKPQFSPSEILDKTWYIVRHTKNTPWDDKDCPQSKYTNENGKLVAKNYKYSISANIPEFTTGILNFRNGAAGTGEISCFV